MKVKHCTIIIYTVDHIAHQLHFVHIRINNSTCLHKLSIQHWNATLQVCHIIPLQGFVGRHLQDNEPVRHGIVEEAKSVVHL